MFSSTMSTSRATAVAAAFAPEATFERSPSAFEETSAATSAPCFRVPRRRERLVGGVLRGVRLGVALDGHRARLLPREGGNSRDRDLGGSRGGSIPGVSKDARVRTTRARAAWKRARAGLWRRRRVPRLGEWRSPDHFVSNAPNPRALVLHVSFAVTAMSAGVRHRCCDPTNYCCRRREKAARTLSVPDLNSTRGAPDPSLGAGSARFASDARCAAMAPAAAAGATVGAAARAPPPRLVCPPSSGRSAPPRRERRGRAWTWTTRRTRGSRSCAWAARAGPRVVTRKRAGPFRDRDPCERAAEAYPRVIGRRFLKPM